ncbi:MAG: hypothetical protein RJA30_460 [Actinomycetota bacterium]|jgi:hypothetical protein
MSPKTDKIDELSKQLEEKIERGVTNWVYNDQFFNFLRTTPARWMLALVAVGTLYGYGVYAWITEGITGYVYPVLIFGAVLLQKLSVRFAFDDDSNIDEYQHTRRNRAYRRAYKRSGWVLALVLMLMLVRSWEWTTSMTAQNMFWPLPNGALNFNCSIEQAVIGLEFLIGHFVIQKYLSWGMRGERN